MDKKAQENPDNIVKNKKHLGSVFIDEQILLKSILDLHNDGKEIELDPMYNKGKFYKKIINAPKHKFDLNPLLPEVKKGDAKDLPFLDNSIKSMILDPPFLFNKWDKKSKILARYTKYDSQEELTKEYDSLIKEASRVLKHNGLLIFKCQDLTTGGKTYINHLLVAKQMEKYGFYLKDLVLLNKENKMYKSNTTQRHFRKTHTYFFIGIRKKEKKND